MRARTTRPIGNRPTLANECKLARARAAQASIKLAGQILALEAFVCDPRPSEAHQLQQASPLHHGSLPAGAEPQSDSASSPLGSSSSISANSGGSGAPAGGSAAHQQQAANLEHQQARPALFLAVVSQKQARVYRIPAGAQAADPNHPNQSQSLQQQQQQSDGDGPAPSATGPQANQSHFEANLSRLLTNKRNLVSSCELSDSSFACRAQLVKWRSPHECCLVSYLATGNLLVHPLPRLRAPSGAGSSLESSAAPGAGSPLLEADFVPYTSARVARSMCFSQNGHCLYQASPGEICKFTLSSSYRQLVGEMLGVAYVPRDMPEQPRANFFKSLFSASQASKQSDRDELFGECASGKPARNVAKHASEPSTDRLKSAAIGTMGHEMRLAREGLDERAERLSELEDRTLNMMNQSEAYSQAAHQLAQKFKDKKWYQF